jgi:hypothetical protein
MRIPVWIPTASLLDLAPGSAVVTRPDASKNQPLLQGWFEGNCYQASNLQRFADRAQHAADRLLSSYPTTATRGFTPSDLYPVGELDTETGVITLDPAATHPLLAWLEVSESELAEQLLTTSARQTAQRELLTMDPLTRAFLKRNGPSLYQHQAE